MNFTSYSEGRSMGTLHKVPAHKCVLLKLFRLDIECEKCNCNAECEQWCQKYCVQHKHSIWHSTWPTLCYIGFSKNRLKLQATQAASLACSKYHHMRGIRINCLKTACSCVVVCVHAKCTVVIMCTQFCWSGVHLSVCLSVCLSDCLNRIHRRRKLYKLTIRG